MKNKYDVIAIVITSVSASPLYHVMCNVMYSKVDNLVSVQIVHVSSVMCICVLAVNLCIERSTKKV